MEVPFKVLLSAKATHPSFLLSSISHLDSHLTATCVPVHRVLGLAGLKFHFWCPIPVSVRTHKQTYREIYRQTSSLTISTRKLYFHNPGPDVPVVSDVPVPVPSPSPVNHHLLYPSKSGLSNKHTVKHSALDQSESVSLQTPSPWTPKSTPVIPAYSPTGSPSGSKTPCALTAMSSH